MTEGFGKRTAPYGEGVQSGFDAAPFLYYRHRDGKRNYPASLGEGAEEPKLPYNLSEKK